MVSAFSMQEKTQERLHLSLSKGRKFLTDHPKKTLFTFIFALGISCDQIAKIIRASVRGGELWLQEEESLRLLRKHRERSGH